MTTSPYDAQIVVAGSGSVTANTFYPPAGALDGLSTTESDVQFKVRDPGTFKNLFVNIITNGANAASTITARKNAANTTLSVSIPATTTGNFEDTTHTYTVVAGDNISISFTYGGTGTAVAPGVISQLFTSSTGSNTTSFLYDSLQKAYSTSGTYYWGLNSYISGNATESHAIVEPNVVSGTTTFQYLYVNCITNTDSSFSHTVTSRKNSAAGAMSISMSASTTGIFEDTTHSDSIAAATTDSIDFSFNASTMTGTVTFRAGVTMINNAMYYLMTGTDPNAFTGAINSGTHSYLAVSGGPTKNTTESNVQMKARNTGLSVQGFCINVTLNSVNAATAITTRSSGVSLGNNGTSLSSGTTGTFFITNRPQNAVASTGLLNYMIDTSSSTSGSVTVVGISVAGVRTPILNSYTISESSITVSDSLKRIAIPKITTISYSISDSLKRKVIPTGLTNTITVLTGNLLRKAIPNITTQTTTTSDSIVPKRVLHKSITESSITISSSLLRKVIPSIIEPLISLSQQIKKFAKKTPMTEGAISVTSSLKLTNIRNLTESISSITQTVKKLAVKQIQGQSITVSSTVILKNIKKISEGAITVGAGSLSRLLKNIRNITESYSIHSDSVVKKDYKKTTSTTTTSDSLHGARILPHTLSETISNLSSASISLKTIKKIPVENITVGFTTLLKKAFKIVTEQTNIIVSNTVSLKTVKKPSTSVLSTSDAMSTFLNARRSFIETVSPHNDTLVGTHIHKISLTEPSITASDGTNVISKRIRIRNIIQVIPTLDSVNRTASFFRTTVEDNIAHLKDKINTTYINRRIKFLFDFGYRLKKI